MPAALKSAWTGFRENHPVAATLLLLLPLVALVNAFIVYALFQGHEAFHWPLNH